MELSYNIPPCPEGQIIWDISDESEVQMPMVVKAVHDRRDRESASDYLVEIKGLPGKADWKWIEATELCTMTGGKVAAEKYSERVEN